MKYLGQIMAIIAITATLVTTSSGLFSYIQSLREDQKYKYELIDITKYNLEKFEEQTKKQREMLSFEIDKITNKVNSINNQSIPNKSITTKQIPKNKNIGSPDIEIPNVQYELQLKEVSNKIDSALDAVNVINSALGSNIEKSLSIPLLRKDLDRIESDFKQKKEEITREIDRIYDLTKWFIGLMATMTLAVLTIAINNYQSSKEKPKNKPPNPSTFAIKTRTRHLQHNKNPSQAGHQ